MSDEFPFDRSKLELSFDVNQLQDETTRAISSCPPYVYYSVIPLTTMGQINTDVTDFSDPNWTTWETTSLLQQSPYFQEVLDSLDCQKTNVRLMRLAPSGEVKLHTDPQLNLDFRNQVRLHVPIFVDEQITFELNETVVPLQAGELWYMRLSDPHSVTNRSDKERIQLSIDVVVNDWIEERIVRGETA